LWWNWLAKTHRKSIANCWQCAGSTIVLVDIRAASLNSIQGRHRDICNSLIETAQKACKLYLTWLDTATRTSVNGKFKNLDLLKIAHFPVCCNHLHLGKIIFSPRTEIIFNF
jgi:hypothetical protein